MPNETFAPHLRNSTYTANKPAEAFSNWSIPQFFWDGGALDRNEFVEESMQLNCVEINFPENMLPATGLTLSLTGTSQAVPYDGQKLSYYSITNALAYSQWIQTNWDAVDTVTVTLHISFSINRTMLVTYPYACQIFPLQAESCSWLDTTVQAFHSNLSDIEINYDRLSSAPGFHELFMSVKHGISPVSDWPSFSCGNLSYAYLGESQYYKPASLPDSGEIYFPLLINAVEAPELAFIARDSARLGHYSAMSHLEICNASPKTAASSAQPTSAEENIHTATNAHHKKESVVLNSLLWTLLGSVALIPIACALYSSQKNKKLARAIVMETLRGTTQKVILWNLYVECLRFQDKLPEGLVHEVAEFMGWIRSELRACSENDELKMLIKLLKGESLSENEKRTLHERPITKAAMETLRAQVVTLGLRFVMDVPENLEGIPELEEASDQAMRQRFPKLNELLAFREALCSEGGGKNMPHIYASNNDLCEQLGLSKGQELLQRQVGYYGGRCCSSLWSRRGNQQYQNLSLPMEGPQNSFSVEMSGARHS